MTSAAETPGASVTTVKIDNWILKGVWLKYGSQTTHNPEDYR